MGIKKKAIEIPKQNFDKEGTFCVWEVYSKSKKTIYHMRGNQASYVSSVTLQGFLELPSGLYLKKDGWGFGKKGTFLLGQIKTHISKDKKIELVITKENKKGIKETGLTVTVTLPYLEVKKLLSRLGHINEQNNSELREEASSFLSTKFPKKISVSAANFDEYKAGEIYTTLSKNKVADKLNEDDLDALEKLFPKIFQSSIKKQKVLSKKHQLIQKSKRITDQIYLDEVIKEFEKNLEKKTLPEEIWQKFLKEKALRYLSSYVTSIDKENISIEVSYPDFVVVDVSGFVDIFEIKTHVTQLMAYDESHENFYWRTEVAKAISQIENYIDAIIHNSDDYIRKIKRKKGLDIKVIRPRGYIIAGSSKQFKNHKEFEDFRKLSCSLKNTDFILYDQLLQNLKNLRSKL